NLTRVQSSSFCRLERLSQRDDMAAELLRIAHRSEILKGKQTVRASTAELFELPRCKCRISVQSASSPFERGKMAPGRISSLVERVVDGGARLLAIFRRKKAG